MPSKPNATHADAEGVQRLLRILGYEHLRARLVRAAVIVESGSESDPDAHLRLVRVGTEDWRVDTPATSGRWNQTPIVGPRGNVIAEVHQSFPWFLAKLRPGG
jgi:hypothetical protein